MINFSINTEIRQKIIFFLAILSTATMSFITPFIKSLTYEITIPSSFAIFGFYFWLFDNYLWKIWPMRKIHNIPDLAGHWEGLITQPNDPDYIYYPVDAVIEQSWTKIQIEVVGKNTRSKLVSASMDLSVPTRRSLDFIYVVKPTIERNDENKRGEGYQCLLVENENLLSGYYFSSKLRKGKLTLKRKNDTF